MKILVTGGTGYIGSHTVKALKAAGHTVHIFDSLEHGHESVLDTLDCRDTFIQGDIRNLADLEKAFASPPDAVIHFAAYIEAGESVTVPEKFFANNTAGTINLLQTMRAHNVHRFVFSSTAAVYGQPDVMPIPESAHKAPTNPYGTSKLLVEYAITDLTRYTPMKATILRYFNACGADPDGQLGENHHPETHLIPLVLQVASETRHAIKIFGTDYPTPDGTAVRDYIHVSDLARAHVMALESIDSTADSLRTFNVGTGHGYSVKEVIETCRTVTNHPIPASEEPRRAGDPAELVADASSIRKELKWEPRHSDLQTIIQTAWDWARTSS